MATFALPLLPLILSIFYTIAAAAAATVTATAADTSFIDMQCKTTRYPAECVKFLSPHAAKIQQNQLTLTQTALTVSLENTLAFKTSLNALANLKGLRANEHAALKDCLDSVDDSLEQLTQSTREINTLSQAQGEDFMLHKSNLQTWVSAVLSNHDSCTESFVQPSLNGKVKSSVTAQTSDLEKMISNSLAFINAIPAKN